MVGDPHGLRTKPTLGAPPAHLGLHALGEDISGVRARNDVVGPSLRKAGRPDSGAGRTFVFGMMHATCTTSGCWGLSEAA
jgi:hypothetical protein